MKRRPWSLVLLAFFHFLAPFGNVIFNALISKRGIASYVDMAASPAYLSKNWVMFIAPIIAGIAIYACKKWSFYVYLLSITALFAFSYYAFQSKGGSLSPMYLGLAYVVNISVVIYFLIPAVRNVYFDRRMRWWEIKPRYQCDYKANWKFEEDEVIHDGEVGNISVNGLFLKSIIMPRDQDLVEITIPFNEGVVGKFTGQVIFHKAAKKIGFGVQFVHTKDSKKLAKEIVQFLDDNGQRINALDIRPEDSLTYWIRTLVTTGKGLLPKSGN